MICRDLGKMDGDWLLNKPHQLIKILKKFEYTNSSEFLIEKDYPRALLRLKGEFVSGSFLPKFLGIVSNALFQ